MRVYIMILIIGLLAYFCAIMPIRNYLCEKHNMTAVWYLQGCVLKVGGNGIRASRYKDKEKLRKTRNAQNKRYFSKTAIYKPRRWTDIEDVIVLEHKNTDMEISKQIERSVKAIQVRRVKLKKIEELKQDD